MLDSIDRLREREQERARERDRGNSIFFGKVCILALFDI